MVADASRCSTDPASTTILAFAETPISGTEQRFRNPASFSATSPLGNGQISDAGPDRGRGSARAKASNCCCSKASCKNASPAAPAPEWWPADSCLPSVRRPHRRGCQLAPASRRAGKETTQAIAPPGQELRSETAHASMFATFQPLPVLLSIRLAKKGISRIGLLRPASLLQNRGLNKQLST